MKKLFLLFVVLLLAQVFAQTTSLNIADQQNDSALSSDAPDRAILISLNGKLNQMPTLVEMDSSFQQLDQRMSDEISRSFANFIAFAVFIIVINDAILLALFFILKSKGLI